MKDHLIFALKFEGINLEILNALFQEVDHKDIECFIKETPEGKSSFEIERATPDQRRAARFVELLRLADDRKFFDKPSLIELQRAKVLGHHFTQNKRIRRNARTLLKASVAITGL